MAWQRVLPVTMRFLRLVFQVDFGQATRARRRVPRAAGGLELELETSHVTVQGTAGPSLTQAGKSSASRIAAEERTGTVAGVRCDTAREGEEVSASVPLPVHTHVQSVCGISEVASRAQSASLEQDPFLASFVLCS